MAHVGIEPSLTLSSRVTYFIPKQLLLARNWIIMPFLIVHGALSNVAEVSFVVIIQQWMCVFVIGWHWIIFRHFLPSLNFVCFFG